MDLDDLPPAGGGSLRGPAGTFTQTGVTHPDSIWNPRGGETYSSRPWRSAPVSPAAADSSRPSAAEYEGADVGRTVRAALRYDSF